MPEHFRVTRHISGDFFTPTFRMTGRVGVGNSGLIGLLNDETHSIMTFENVYLSRILEPGKIVAHYDTVHMAKRAFEMAILSKRDDIGPASVVSSGYSRMKQHSVLITTDTFEVQGIIEQPGRLEASGLMAAGAGVTLAVFDATVTATACPEVTYSGAGILLNRHNITVICA